MVCNWMYRCDPVMAVCNKEALVGMFCLYHRHEPLTQKKALVGVI